MASVYDHHVVNSLDKIPSDVILQILSFLDADDVLSLSGTSRFFNKFSNTYIIWHNVLLNLLHRARYIDLLSLDNKPIRSAEAHELKRSVIRASRADKNWLSKHPKALGPPKTISLQQDNSILDISMDQVSYITKFTSRHLMIPLNNGGILGWDIERNVPAGKYDASENAVLMDIALDRETQSFVALLGVVAPVRHGASFGIHIRMTVLRIGVPKAENEALSFTNLTKFTVLVPFTSEVHLLDASRKMLCIVYQNEESDTLCILLVHNWDTEECSLIDTNVPYSYGRTLIGLHLSEDGEKLILVSEDKGREIRRFFQISHLERSAELWNTLDNYPRLVVPPTTGHIFDWKNEIQELQDEEATRPYLFWQLDQIPSPPYKNIPARVSTIVLYVTSTDNGSVEEFEEEGFVIVEPPKRTWRIAQYYSDRNGPCSDARSFATIRNPALSKEPIELEDQIVPLMCLSFNHFGWIEEVDDTSNENKKIRVLKLMTFPDPGCTYEGDLADTAKTMDIPSEVLDDANHILLDATQGLIVVATNSKTLCVYHY